MCHSGTSSGRRQHRCWRWCCCPYRDQSLARRRWTSKRSQTCLLLVRPKSKFNRSTADSYMLFQLIITLRDSQERENFRRAAEVFSYGHVLGRIHNVNTRYSFPITVLILVLGTRYSYSEYSKQLYHVMFKCKRRHFFYRKPTLNIF